MELRKIYRLFLGLFLVVACASSGCLSKASDRSPTSISSLPWKAGPPSPHSFFFLGKVWNGDKFCTGSLIACGRLVLTAGHCATSQTLSFVAHHDPSHTKWPALASWSVSPTGGHGDIALLQIARAPTGTTTASFARNPMSAFPAQLRFAGYGMSHPEGPSGTLLQGEVNVLGIFNGESFWRGWRHTVVANTQAHKGNYVSANGPNAVLPGDSGAPLLHGPFIQGIVSQVNEGMDPETTIGFIVPTTDHVAWIESKITAVCGE